MIAVIPALALAMTTALSQSGATGSRATIAIALAAAGVVATVAAALVVARTITTPLRRLGEAAERASHLQTLVEALRRPTADDQALALAPVGLPPGGEIGGVAQAFDAFQGAAVRLAVGQAALLNKTVGEKGTIEVFVNLARRMQGLVDHQIEFLDGLEAEEQDADTLENLFKLDQLATRVRRNAESLLTLAGAATARSWERPLAMSDVIRAGMAEVEDIGRVDLLIDDDAAMLGNVAADAAHLLSELLENATRWSPPETRVEVSGTPAAGGYAVTIEDRGIGMTVDALAEANHILTGPPLAEATVARSLGLVVTGRLARRLGIVVRLTSAGTGTVAKVLIPPTLMVVADGEMLEDIAAGPARSLPFALARQEKRARISSQRSRGQRPAPGAPAAATITNLHEQRWIEDPPAHVEPGPASRWMDSPRAVESEPASRWIEPAEAVEPESHWNDSPAPVEPEWPSAVSAWDEPFVPVEPEWPAATVAEPALEQDTGWHAASMADWPHHDVEPVASAPAVDAEPEWTPAVEPEPEPAPAAAEPEWTAAAVIDEPVAEQLGDEPVRAAEVAAPFEPQWEPAPQAAPPVRAAEPQWPAAVAPAPAPQPERPAVRTPDPTPVAAEPMWPAAQTPEPAPAEPQRLNTRPPAVAPAAQPQPQAGHTPFAAAAPPQRPPNPEVAIPRRQPVQPPFVAAPPRLQQPPAPAVPAAPAPVEASSPAPAEPPPSIRPTPSVRPARFGATASRPLAPGTPVLTAEAKEDEYRRHLERATAAGLVRRVPKASLPNDTGGGAKRTPKTGGDLPVPERLPDEVRSLLSSYRSGVQRGRAEGPNDDQRTTTPEEQP